MTVSERVKYNIENHIQDNPYKYTDKEWLEYNREYNICLGEYTQNMTEDEYIDYYRKVYKGERADGQIYMFDENPKPEE